MKTVCVTGTKGQDGSYLAEKYLAKGWKVIGVDVWEPTGVYTNLKEAVKNPNFILETGDISQEEFVRSLFKKYKIDLVYNMAGISLVPESFKIPRRVLEVNTYGVLNFLETIRDLSPTTRFYQASCYDKETRVLTLDGLKTYKEVKVGDLVFTINEDTNELELKPIKRVIESYYKGNDMVRLDSRRFNFLVTPNHKMLIEKEGKNFYNDACTLNKILKYEKVSNVSLPTPIWNGKDEEYKELEVSEHFNMNKIKKMEMNDFLYLLGIFIGDGCARKKRTIERVRTKEENCKRRNNKGKFIKLDIDDVKKKSFLDSADIDFYIPEEDKCWQRLKSVLDKYNIKYHRYGIDVYFSCYGLHKEFIRCGGYAHEKHIPREYLSLSSKHLIFLYDGLIDSDGGRRSYTTISKVLYEQFIELCIKIGLVCKVYPKQKISKPFIKGRIINSTPAFVIGLSFEKTKRKIYKSNLKKENYDDIVWCLEIEDNHNFLVERNGFFMFSGNSSEQIGENKELPQNNDSKMIPNSPYAVSKMASYFLVRLYRKAFGLFVVNGLLFNHEGARRGLNFVTRKISRAVARISKGLDESISLGNLDSCRDWGNSEDYMDCLILIMEADEADDYTLATGESHSVREFVEEAFKNVGINITWQGSGLDEVGIDQNGIVRVRVDEKYYRPVEVAYLCGDYSKVKSKFGWKPKTKFKELVEKMVENDLNEIK